MHTGKRNRFQLPEDELYDKLSTHMPIHGTCDSVLNKMLTNT